MSEIYRKRYEKFIKHRLDNPLFKKVDGVYVEKHHIKPVSFFPEGTSQKVMDKDNTVYLTAREHFIAHCFLAKIYDVGCSKWHKTNKAMDIMSGKSKDHKERYSNSRLYEHLKTKYYKQVNKENEEKCLERINQICDWIDVNDRTPKELSEDSIEMKMAKKIGTLKQAKRGNKKWIFYQSYQELAEKRGYPKLFDFVDFEKESIYDIVKICDFIDKYGVLPKATSKDTLEKRFGYKIGTLKQAKQNKGNTIFYKSYQELVEDRGYPDLFNSIEDDCLIQINEICDWIDINNRKPKQHSSDDIESQMSRKINNLKQIKCGNATVGIFNKSYQSLIEQRGYPKLFDFINIEEDCLIQINKICDFIDKYNRTPKRHYTNPIDYVAPTEKKLGSKLSSLRQSKKGKKGMFYESYQELAESRGYPNLFDPIKTRKGV